MLIGEAFMASKNIGAKMREIMRMNMQSKNLRHKRQRKQPQSAAGAGADLLGVVFAAFPSANHPAEGIGNSENC